MAPIRVLLGQMPAMLRDILDETFASQNDVILVGTCDRESALRDAVDRLTPDVVLVGVEQQDWAGGYLDLFRDHPDLRLLAIRNDARAAAMHECRIRRCSVAELSPASILAAVRAGCDGVETGPALSSRAQRH